MTRYSIRWTIRAAAFRLLRQRRPHQACRVGESFVSIFHWWRCHGDRMFENLWRLSRIWPLSTSLLILFYDIPISSATEEHNFTLRTDWKCGSTMTQQRINHCALLRSLARGTGEGAGGRPPGNEGRQNGKITMLSDVGGAHIGYLSLQV